MVKTGLELVTHPIRLRVVQVIRMWGRLTTKEISEYLEEVPLSSLYRHLRLLRESGVIDVVGTRWVNGSEEKIYEVVKIEAHDVIDLEELAGLTAEQHIDNYATVVNTFMMDLSDYLKGTPKPDLLADEVEIGSAFYYATAEEAASIRKAIVAILHGAEQNTPGEGRTLRKFCLLTHPIKRRGKQ